MRLPIAAKSLILRAYLRLLKWSGRTIVLGPYTSELGFEVLYFMPFLQWALKDAGIPITRCVALSRGGMGVFYPAECHVDIYTLRSVDEVRIENTKRGIQTGKQKQEAVTAWDRAIAHEAVERLQGAGARFVLLHPSWLHWLFADVWENRASLQAVFDHTIYARLPIPELPEGLTLPEKFIAVRIYERHTLPLHEGVRAQLIAMVQALASHIPVVLLNQGLFADDHTDLPISGSNIFTLPAVPPEQNFILQAAVLARCQGFVGTYGGVAQWALRYEKPSISYYVHFQGTAQCHRTLSAMLSASMNVPFEVSQLGMVKLWGMTLTRNASAEETAA